MTAIPLAAWVVMLAPPLAIAAGFILRSVRPRTAHWPMLVSCAMVAAAAVSLAARVYSGGALDAPIYSWALAGSWSVPLGLRIDGLSAMMLLLISVVGGLIHLYSVGYMEEDPGFDRFFLCFHFFYMSMLGLVIANNYLQLYLFWEMVGAASYILIGFWYQKGSASRAALKAFLTNRVGDFGFLAAVLMLMAIAGGGEARFSRLFQLAPSINPDMTAMVGLLLLWAATAKSAQFPLYFWLPDAMEGPTPVSALMHAATMVTAGIFLLARSWPLIGSVAGLPNLIAWTGAGTALGAAVVASTKTDLKRILAYSTVSHLGIMAMGLGLGRVGGAMFHLLTHGFFKATLFLCAGNIAHALGKSTASVEEAGGLRRSMPRTFWCFAIAACSLAGIFPLAGFFSKDAIIEAAMARGGAMSVAGLAIAFGSAFYIFRMLFLVFWGPRAWQHPPEHAHEAGPVMMAPVALLAAGAAAVGWFAPALMRLLVQGWAGPFEALEIPGFAWAPFLGGTAMVLLGVAAAHLATIVLPQWDFSWRRDHPAWLRVFEADFGFKSVVSLAVAATRVLSTLVGGIWDGGVVDGVLVEGTAPLGRAFSNAVGAVAEGSLNDYLWWMAAGAAILLGVALRTV